MYDNPDGIVRALARRLVASARMIGEPCDGAQCWMDLRDEYPHLSETQARALINEVRA